MKINYRTEDNKLSAKFAKAKLAASALEKTMDAVVYVNGKKYEIESAEVYQGDTIYDAKLKAEDGTELRAQTEIKDVGGRKKVVIRLKV